MPIANADALGGISPDINVLGIDVLGNGNGKRSHTGTGVTGLSNVSTAPSTRSVVIRDTSSAAQAKPEVSPVSAVVTEGNSAPIASAAPIVDAVPATALGVTPPVPAAVPAPAKPPAAPAIRPAAPNALPIPATAEPRPGHSHVPAATRPAPARIPDSFRVGYAEYLRAATTTDLVVAAVPGLAGIAGFTLIGAYTGYRQARAVQVALLPPVATRIFL